MSTRRIAPWALMLILALSAFGCGDDDPVQPQSVDEFALATAVGDAYFTDYTTPNLGLPVNTTAEKVWLELNQKASNYYIIDWRSQAAYDYAHIQGAVRMDLADLVDNLPSIPAEKVILNVCYTGQTASTATAVMNLLGRDAQNLKFGMYGWVSDSRIDEVGRMSGSTPLSYPLVDTYDGWMENGSHAHPNHGSAPQMHTGRTNSREILQTRAREYLQAGWKKVSIDDVYPELTDPPRRAGWFVLNYFPLANYDAGHIPGAVRYQPNNDLRSGELLRTLPKDKKILVYCWTGQTSAQVTAYLNMLGYDAYSLLYGVHSMCANNATINTVRFHAPPEPGYPTVPSNVEM